MPMPPDPETDLHWIAFLYVTGDLDPGASSAFESRLALDQDAREAVAVAVELAGSLAVACRDEVAAPGPRSGRRRALVAALAMAAAACVVAAILPALRPTGSDAAASASASEVALAWSGLRGGADLDWASAVAGPPEVEADAEAVDPIEGPADRALPSWLLTAAAVPRPETPARED